MVLRSGKPVTIENHMNKSREQHGRTSIKMTLSKKRRHALEQARMAKPKKSRELSPMSETDTAAGQEMFMEENDEQDDEEDGFVREHRPTAEERAEEEVLREWEDAAEVVIDLEEELEDPRERAFVSPRSLRNPRVWWRK